MNKEQQRIKIAEACGYVWDNGRIGVCGWWTDPSGLQVSWGQNKLKAMSQILIIDYLNDLNAMHEAEEILTIGQRGEFWDVLHRMVERHEFWGDDTTNDICFRVMHATAAQRTEAFLKTLGLWEEGE